VQNYDAGGTVACLGETNVLLENSWKDGLYGRTSGKCYQRSLNFLDILSHSRFHVFIDHGRYRFLKLHKDRVVPGAQGC